MSQVFPTFLLLVPICISFAFPLPTTAADRLVLRNLKIITDRTAVALDDDGVRLDDDRIITWDEIERGTVGAGKQAAFDTFLREVGEPLFRVRQRLKVSDYEGALAPAETLFPRFANRRSNSGYLVAQALMWGRMAAGNREGAVVPYFYCFEFLRDKKKEDVVLPGDRRLSFDKETGYSSELPPIWFDATAAKRTLGEVQKAEGSIREPKPEAMGIYYASLALATGEKDAATKSLLAVSGTSRITLEFREILMAEQEILAGKPGEATSGLRKKAAQMSSLTKPIALYWLGRALLLADDERTQREGVLQLLHVPARYGMLYPDVAGAALFDSMRALEKLNDLTGSIALRKELLQHFGQTFHAACVRKEVSRP